MEGRKSVSSDCTTSTNDSATDRLQPRISAAAKSLEEAFQFRAAAAAAAAEDGAVDDALRI